MPDTREPALFKPEQPEEHAREIALIVREILQGKTNNRILITLTPNSTQTVIERARISVDTIVNMTAQTASAAAAQGVWVETTFGQITIHHDSTGDTDRIFGAVLVG